MHENLAIIMPISKFFVLGKKKKKMKILKWPSRLLKIKL